LAVIRVHGSAFLRPGSTQNWIDYDASTATQVRIGTDTSPTSYRAAAAVTITYSDGHSHAGWTALTVMASPWSTPTRLIFVGNFAYVIGADAQGPYAEVDISGATSITVGDPGNALPPGAATRIQGGQSADWYSTSDPTIGPHTPP
jgi:hypothetical protein